MRIFASLLIVLVCTCPAHAQNPAVTISVDAAANRRPINPNIYGVAHATTAAAERPEQPAQPQRRQQHDALQLAAERRQSRQRLVLREHRRQQRDARASAATPSSPTRAPRTRRPMLTIPMIDWVAKVGPNRSKLAELLDREVRRADRQRLAVVPRRGQRRPDQRPVRHRQRSERRQRALDFAVSSRAGCSTWSAAGARMRTAACATTSSTTSRASGTQRTATSIPTGATMDEIRNKMIDYAGRIKAVDPTALVVGPGRMGLERLPLQRLRSAVRQRARLELPSRPQQSRRRRLPAVAARPAAPATLDDRAAPARRLHRPLLPAGRRVQRRRLDRHAAAAQPLDAFAVGSRPTSMRPGSTTACS